MADAPYLICLALLEQGGQRALPINGKSQQQPLAEGADPGDDGCTLALELLVRLWQRSDEQGALCRSAGDQSLLLVQLPQEVMQEQLPRLKAQWIASGDTAAFLDQLRQQADGLWRLTLARYEPLCFTPLEA